MYKNGSSFFSKLTLFFWIFTASWVSQVQAASFAYIANHIDNSVSVIDTDSNTVVATPAVGRNPFGVAVNPSGTRVYVTNLTDGTVSVLDTSNNTVIATITVGGNPYGITITPDGNHAYVANWLSNTVSVISTNTNTVTATIPVGDGPFGIDVNPAGSRVYVTNNAIDTLSVIDTSTNTVIAVPAPVPTGDVPWMVAITPSGNHAYVAHYNVSDVLAIDTNTNSVVSTIPLGGYIISGLAVNPSGSLVYAANFNNSTVQLINTSSNTVADSIPVGSSPYGLAITPSGSHVYVANHDSNTVSVIDTTTNTVTATITVGRKPIAVGKLIGPNMCTPAPADTTSWWGGDNNALDMVGTNHGTLVNDATYAAGKVNQAFSFDGTDDYVEMSGNATGVFGASAFTVDFWMYANNNGSNTYLMGKSDPDGGTGWDVRLDNNTIQVIGVNGWGFNITSDASVTAGAWHHISISATDTQVNLYIDGVLKGTSARNTISTTTNPFRIGDTSNFGGTAFNGFIDEVDVFNRALTGEEIAAIYNTGSAGKCRSCVPPPSDMAAWWKAENDGEDSVGTHDGTLINGTTFAPGKVGTAFKFDGADDAVHVGMLGNVGLNETQPFSLSAWVNSHAPATGSQVIAGNYMGETGGTGSFSTYLRINNSKLIFTIDRRQLAATTIETEILSGWQYVTATYDGTSLKLFINGTLKSSTDRTFTDSTANTRGWDIGNFSPETNTTHGISSSFNGEIDELAIFDRALSAEEVAASYNAGGTGACAIDNIPDDFTFTDQTGVNINTVITSNSITINGINYATDISIAFCPNTSCQYQINSDGWTSIAGTVNNGDTISVRQTSSNGYSGGTDLVLAIGSKSDTFSVSTMEPPQYSVTPSQTGSGTIDPSTPQTVTHSGYTTFTVTPDAGHSVSMGGTCGGTLTGATYATDAIIADCTVIATFTPDTYTVTPIKTDNGTITPATPQTIIHGNAATFTITPDTGHSVSMGGTCGGTLTGTLYTTDAIN